MKNIVYLSKANVEFTQASVEELALKSMSKNKELNITGYLCFFEGTFIQYIEGEEETLDKLLNTIKKDPRHNYIYGVERNNRKDRLFPSWNMRHIYGEELKKYNLEKYMALNILSIKEDSENKEHSSEVLWKHVDIISKTNNKMVI